MAVCKYEQLSKNQKELVRDILSDNNTRRKRILGSAGSGKTTIIAICANKLVKNGKDVLICCYNKSLLKYIKKIVNGDMEKSINLTIDNYHHFMWHYIEGRDRIEFRKHEYGNNVINSDGYRIPDLYKKAIYDYIFIDEMQDLRPNAIANLIDLLKENGKICAFADKYQKLYNNNKYENEEENFNSNVPKFPHNAGFRGRWTRLNEVFRANNLIQEKAMEFARQELFPVYGVENIILSGKRVDSQIIYVPNFSIEAIVDYISRMTKIDQKNTVVMFDEKKDIEDFTVLLDKNNIDYISINNSKDKFDLEYKGIKISTVKSFKGLELPICIYICNNKIESYEDEYVAITRATKKLIICNSNKINPLFNLYSEYKLNLFT